MYANIDFITTIRIERERSIRDDRLARLAARLRDCCRPSVVSRLARAMSRRIAPSQELPR
jgi:hypothetical protein